ncbi:ABC transporter substrate binding protein [Desulfoplanes formicivorans]|uniref:ABC transporter substrate-binding protein n=1 Tax=Desulfoplanes formicivorans TaxID=1592317 RepID=A0A194AHQ6_9BACT|nr:ABC transporter substrate binding protein [Desulfoplanes formicivorans]GAU08611.1 hypothetical protein DPF_1325 [Desulfoplanes formicivorans]
MRILAYCSFFFLCWGICSPCLAANSSSAPAAPTSQPSDVTPKARNIAYFEAGPYWEFAIIQDHVVEALGQRGILDHLAFPERLVISPGWVATEDVYRAEARKLMNDPSVDLIISMGTVATQALLAENNGKTPIVSIDVADPVGSGIVDAETGKGPANLTLYYIKDKWRKVFVLFYQALPFKRLGIMYHDSPEGRSYSNLNEAREVAREYGFTLVEYADLDKEESVQSCAAGVNTLLKKDIDAFYISALNCFDWTHANPKPILDLLHEHGIWTFARDGSVQVRHGALMGLSTLDYIQLAEFYADRIGHLLGLLPEDTPLVQGEYHPKITLNLDTAESMHLDVPRVLLITADEIFDSSLTAVRDVHMEK